MKKLSFLTLKGAISVSALLLFGHAQAADPSVEMLLAKMRKAYQTTKPIGFSTESHIGAKVFMSNITFYPPSKIRISVTSTTEKALSKPAIITADGKTISVQPAGSPLPIVFTFSADQLERNIAGNLESICFFDWDRQLSTAPGKNMEHSKLRILPNRLWNGKSWIVLEENAPKDKVTCEYYIDPATNLIWRTVTRALPGGKPAMDSDDHIIKMGPAKAMITPKTNVIHV